MIDRLILLNFFMYKFTDSLIYYLINLLFGYSVVGYSIFWLFDLMIWKVVEINFLFVDWLIFW